MKQALWYMRTLASERSIYLELMGNYQIFFLIEQLYFVIGEKVINDLIITYTYMHTYIHKISD